jgi:arginase
LISVIDLSCPRIIPKIEQMKNISIISAPSNLGLRPQEGGKLAGVTKLPGALLNAGLMEALGAQFQAEVPVPEYNRQRNRENYILNPEGIREFSLRLADEVESAVKRGSFPLVLGGDCSILLGNMLGLKRLGRYGLFFIDGHADFYLPGPNLLDSGVAGMDLAFATGRGDDVLSNIDGQKPLVLDEDVAVFGFRDMEEAVSYNMPKLEETALTPFSLPEIRRMGIETAAREGLAVVTRGELEGFWIHIDADALSDEVMPAVDSRQPDGLSYEEFITLLRILLGSERAAGMHIGIFDPDRDSDGTIGRNFKQAIVKGFDKN